jgi:hypothetical protein
VNVQYIVIHFLLKLENFHQLLIVNKQLYDNDVYQ